MIKTFEYCDVCKQLITGCSETAHISFSKCAVQLLLCPECYCRIVLSLSECTQLEEFEKEDRYNRKIYDYSYP